MRLEIDLVGDPLPATVSQPTAEVKAVAKRNRLKEASENPFVRKAMELFDAEPVDVRDPSTETET